jgi:hypothetical protein
MNEIECPACSRLIASIPMDRRDIFNAPAELARLREALEPFAQFAKLCEGMSDHQQIEARPWRENIHQLSIHHLRTARAALTGSKGG